MTSFNASAGPQAWLDRLFERPAVFNAYQRILDGGKATQIRRFLGELPFDTVLDVGCGTGNWSHLARGGYLGIDTSAAFVEAAARRHRRDAEKKFVLADASEIELVQTFDLCLMISVLHHLSDSKARVVLSRIGSHCRNLLVLDLYPIRWNPVSRLLYAMDRGDHIRTPEEQRKLLEESSGLRTVKVGSYYSPTALYRHTLFLMQNERKD